MDSFIDVLLPRRCLYCQQLIGLGIFCPACASMIKTVRSSGDSNLVHTAFIYGGIIRDLILKAKFHPNESTGRLLARHLSNFLKEPSETNTFLLETNFDCVTYVPSHWKRRLARGYELPALFAAAIAQQMGLPLRHVLSCVRHDAPLSSTPSAGERRTQVENRYEIANKRLQSSRMLIVDDIVTTGATISASAGVLEQAGHQVKCFAFAKTESTSNAAGA